AAAPLTPPSRRMPYAHWLRLVLPYTQHPTAADLNDSIMAEQARRGEAITGRVHYAKWSTRAVYELYQLMRITAVHLPEVTAPLLVLSAAQDQTVLPQDALHIQQQVRSLHIETAVLPQGGHIVLQDVGREAAFAIIGEFLARQAAGPAGSD
nr:alpha/beta hydrolase [Anaerolineae bacterium]